MNRAHGRSIGLAQVVLQGLYEPLRTPEPMLGVLDHFGQVIAAHGPLEEEVQVLDVSGMLHEQASGDLRQLALPFEEGDRGFDEVFIMLQG